MKKSKRFLAAMMAAAMTAGMLTGCGGGKKEDGAAADSAQTGSAEASKEGEKVNLRFVSWQTANKDLDQKVAEAYMKDHPNVTITYDYYGDMTAAEY